MVGAVAGCLYSMPTFRERQWGRLSPEASATPDSADRHQALGEGVACRPPSARALLEEGRRAAENLLTAILSEGNLRGYTSRELLSPEKPSSAARSRWNRSRADPAEVEQPHPAPWRSTRRWVPSSSGGLARVAGRSASPCRRVLTGCRGPRSGRRSAPLRSPWWGPPSSPSSTCGCAACSRPAEGGRADPDASDFADGCTAFATIPTS